MLFKRVFKTPQPFRYSYATGKAAPNLYDITHEKSINPETREQFWENQLDTTTWFKRPTIILDKNTKPISRWFTDGQVNISYNCLDRHLTELGNNPALLYESPVTNTSKTITYKELHNLVSLTAGVLKKFGVEKGDRVIIYMPMIPEAVASMLACSRIGAIHSVVFGGFSAKELGNRIKDSKPKVIITASAGIEGSKIVCYKSIVDDALKLIHDHEVKTLFLERDFHKLKGMIPGRDYNLLEEINSVNPAEAVPVLSSDPLYILYTSGTTGMPKGLVRDQGTTCVALNYSMKYIQDTHKGQVFFSGSDIGWVVGHHYTVYGPLLVGASSILFEGKPVGTPDSSIYWKLIEKHKVRGFYTAPTAQRAIRKEDPEGENLKKHDLSSLSTLSIAGERLDIYTFEWIRKNIPSHVLINDNYWQTETGWSISTNFKNLHTFTPKPGSATKPNMGFDVKILDEETHKPAPPGKLGLISIKLPLPPCFAHSIYNREEAYAKIYLTEAPGYYSSGDAGFFDADGYLHVTTRVDDVINVSGHRLSTSQMEEALLKHPGVVEAAVVGFKDELKGELPMGFVVLRGDYQVEKIKLQKELIEIIRDQIGPVAAYRNSIQIDKLPKTRSGKVLRNVLRKMVDGEEYKVPPTIEDESVLSVIERRVKEEGYGKKKIMYEEDIASSNNNI